MAAGEKIAAFVLVLSGASVSFYSYYYLKLGLMISPDAGFLPFLLGIFMIILGFLWFFSISFPFVKKVSPASEESSGDSSENGERSFYRLLLGISVITLYAWLFERAGYFFSTFLFMLGWQLGVERERMVKTAIITIASTAVMYTLFRFLLRVQLPEGTWFS